MPNDLAIDNSISFELNRNNPRFQNTFSGVDVKVFAYFSFNITKIMESFTRESSFREISKNTENELDRLQIQLKEEELPQLKLLEEEFSQSLSDALLPRLENQRTIVNNLREQIGSLNQLIGNQDLNLTVINAYEKDMLYDLGTINTVSYSMFREKFAVRTLGRTQAKSYTRGPRTVAGTMIFTVFNHFELDNMINNLNLDLNLQINLLDQLPPFNIMMVFTNEYGQASVLHLFDLEFASEGQSQSVHDQMIDRSLNWYCQDLIPLRPVDKIFTSYKDMFRGEVAKIQSSKTEIGTPSSLGKDLITFEQILANTGIEGSEDNLLKGSIQELLRRGRRTTI